MCKRAIRTAWNWSTAYKNLINSANYTCQNCKKKYTNKSRLYAEHIVAIELHDYSTLEEYYWIMRDLKNVQVWGRDCCKEAKDKEDKKLIAERKKIKKLGKT